MISWIVYRGDYGWTMEVRYWIPIKWTKTETRTNNNVTCTQTGKKVQYDYSRSGFGKISLLLLLTCLLLAVSKSEACAHLKIKKLHTLFTVNLNSLSPYFTRNRCSKQQILQGYKDSISTIEMVYHFWTSWRFLPKGGGVSNSSVGVWGVSLMKPRLSNLPMWSATLSNCYGLRSTLERQPNSKITPHTLGADDAGDNHI